MKDLTLLKIFQQELMALIFFFYHIDLSKTPVLYNVKKNKKIINAIIAKAVKTFFLFVFLSGVIIKFYLLKIAQKLKINKV
tara:strand:- start:4 stop:246 length:243 start_codon:yes stop_codon:yes gene_type:complete